jgi:hypothetical protein
MTTTIPDVQVVAFRCLQNTNCAIFLITVLGSHYQ